MSIAVTAAAALTPAFTPVPASAVAAPGRPTCAAPGNQDFPVRTRIHGGPASYDAGGGYRTWYIDLTNTTDGTCGNVHPVVVLVDEKRALKPKQPRLEFYDGERHRPVTFERTEEDENIGVLGGFTVAPGATLSVKVRLAVTSDATVPNDVVAKAAIVQRHDGAGDSDWIGQSNAYRFRILDEDAPSDQDDGGTPEAVPPPDGLPFPDELASTGLNSPRAILAATSGALLLVGALLATRRRR
ncbi:hypothetical protein [Streptomyces sp. NPDC050704]|uniref:hypothetical protein n=1 Tax=Streptomyces sp. NPDC050704 TaxID=3157219 RepID=UPI003437092E